MSDPAANARPVVHYRLRTFGTLALLGPSGETVLGKHGHHRRRLALLAALAAAGDQGRSRDQLLLLFWPDATQSRARHSLEQLLYALRSSLGESAFAGTNPVRLNAEVIASDVRAFEHALERKDLEGAVAEYRGQFLDGFSLSDAPEFEQWAESERGQLGRRYADAVEQLARRAEAEQDHAVSVHWWRTLTELDPVSSKYATGLIRVLMNAGDHPAALQFAERYEAIVQRELGTSAGPAVAGLVAEVRAEARTEPLAAAKPSAAPPATVRREEPTADARLPMEATSATATEPQPHVQPQLQSAGRHQRTAWYRAGAVAMVAIVVATAVWLGTTRRSASATTAAPVAQPSIAVLPFANVSRDARDAVFVDGLAEELMTALYRIPNLRVIERNSAFALRNSDLDVRRTGDTLRVDHVIEGSVVGSSRVDLQACKLEYSIVSPK